MNSSMQVQSTMLLTVSLGESQRVDAKPLSAKEWSRIAYWLKQNDLEASALLQGNLSELLASWSDETISIRRLEHLIARERELSIALEKWQRAGLWAMTLSDPEYPERFKDRLRDSSPPVLFGCGNKKLLGGNGIAVVGSRNADTVDIAFADSLGTAAAKQGYSVVSGGARGVDETSMLGALKHKGTAIGILANDLYRAASSLKYREHVLSGDLVLMSPFSPNARFNVGLAMARNRYVYCLADTAVVVSSTPEKGGTWRGAVENIKAGWVPLWVKHSECTKSGNAELVQMGGKWLPKTGPASIASLFGGEPEGDAVPEKQKATPTQRLGCDDKPVRHQSTSISRQLSLFG